MRAVPAVPLLMYLVTTHILYGKVGVVDAAESPNVTVLVLVPVR